MESGSNGAAPAKTARGTRAEPQKRSSSVAAAKGRKPARKRAPVYIRYYDPETGLTYSNRGPMATWLRAKQEAGENIDKKYRGLCVQPTPEETRALDAAAIALGFVEPFKVTGVTAMTGFWSYCLRYMLSPSSPSFFKKSRHPCHSRH